MRFIRFLQSFAVLFASIALTITQIHAQGIKVKKVTLESMADKNAIKELIDAYAHDADRRDSAAQADLFTPDGILENYEGEPSLTNQPKAVLKGRETLKHAFATLSKYDVTMHFNGQSEINLFGDRATGETYCLAHQFWQKDNQRILMIIGIRYYDTFVRVSNTWYFSNRKLIFDWSDRKPSFSRNEKE